MMPFKYLTEYQIVEIKHRASDDIVSLIGAHVVLKQKGKDYIGLCPFHNEKTPSFNVSPSKHIFKCFGCGRSGNAIKFVMDHQRLEYYQALRAIANHFNILLL